MKTNQRLRCWPPQSRTDLLVLRAYIVTPVAKPKGIIGFISSKFCNLPQIAKVVFQHFTELLTDLFTVDLKTSSNFKWVSKTFQAGQTHKTLSLGNGCSQFSEQIPGISTALSKQWAKTAIVWCRISGIHPPQLLQHAPLKHSFQNGSRRVVNTKDSKYTKLKY